MTNHSDLLIRIHEAKSTNESGQKLKDDIINALEEFRDLWEWLPEDKREAFTMRPRKTQK